VNPLLILYHSQAWSQVIQKSMSLKYLVNPLEVGFHVLQRTCLGFEFSVWGLGFGVWGRVWGLGFGVWGLGFGVWG